MDFNFVYLAFILIILGIGITLHEFMHAFSAYILGDDTAKLKGRVSLNPVKHIDPMTTIAMPIILFLVGLPPFGAAKPVEFNPSRLKFGEYGMAIVAFAGPFTNLVLALLGAGVYHFVLAGSGASAYLINFVLLFSIVNIAFFAFNMIPIPPLDGSRILYAFSPDGIRDILNMIERLAGIFFIFFLILIFSVGGNALGNYMQWMIDWLNLPDLIPI